MTSTQAGCRPSERNAPLSSWSTCGRCRRSWPGCTSAWTCVGRKRKRRKKRTGSLRGCQRSRRRPWLTATWTSCSAMGLDCVYAVHASEIKSASASPPPSRNIHM
uniref:Uncharacterized protein n=1 Tax=Sus scrofa TaxID=9823 RepID=A0A8D1TW43_PIG